MADKETRIEAPGPTEIAWARDVFRDLLKIRASTPLLRLPTAEEIRKRVRFCLESCTVDINSLLAGFAPSKNNLVTFFEISVFDYLQMSVRADHNAGIHAALFR